MAKSTSNSKSSSADGMQEPGRRDFIVVATYAMGAVGAGAVAWPLIDQMNPAADTLALASTEVDVSKIAEGQAITVTWRGKPVFIRHRTP
jgi:ubiquinol-cytochrome c reductase iron-sulfur subunit